MQMFIRSSYVVDFFLNVMHMTFSAYRNRSTVCNFCKNPHLYFSNTISLVLRHQSRGLWRPSGMAVYKHAVWPLTGKAWEIPFSFQKSFLHKVCHEYTSRYFENLVTSTQSFHLFLSPNNTIFIMFMDPNRLLAVCFRNRNVDIN